jgi:hypothetical protein
MPDSLVPVPRPYPPGFPQPICGANPMGITVFLRLRPFQI